MRMQARNYAYKRTLQHMAHTMMQLPFMTYFESITVHFMTVLAACLRCVRCLYLACFVCWRLPLRGVQSARIKKKKMNGCRPQSAIVHYLCSVPGCSQQGQNTASQFNLGADAHMSASMISVPTLCCKTQCDTVRNAAAVTCKILVQNLCFRS